MNRTGNAAYAHIPLRLANACPRCDAGRGRMCTRKVGDQVVRLKSTHAERSALRGRA